MKNLIPAILFAFASIVSACGGAVVAEQQPEKASPESVEQAPRIVSLAGGVTETLVALGLSDQLVGVDVTSIYPENVVEPLPKLGHSRNLSAEGVLSVNPTLILGLEGEINPETKAQLESAGIPLLLFEQGHSLEGSQAFVKAVAEATGATQAAAKVSEQLATDFANAPAMEAEPGVLFVYARGAGTLLVAGSDTPMDAMLGMAGARNVAADIDGYKPLTAEAMVAANPDVLLMFDIGLESLDQADGLNTLPGFSETAAGKNSRVVTMDGGLLTAFGPRTGLAVAELRQKLDAAMKTAPSES